MNVDAIVESCLSRARIIAHADVKESSWLTDAELRAILRLGVEAAMKDDKPLLEVVEELRAVTREHGVKLSLNNEALRRD